MSDTNDKKASSTSERPQRLSLRREKIKLLRVRSELRTGEKKAFTDTSISCTACSCTVSEMQG